MKIASVLENKNIEKRIAITPEIAKKYIASGFEVILSKTYGKHCFFSILGCLEVTRKSSLGAFPGRSRGTFWRSARDSLKDSPQVGAKMCAREAKLGPSWQQVGTSWAMIAPSWRSWAQLGRFWEHVGSILGLFWHMGWIAENLQKLEENSGFWVFGGA